MEKPWHDKETLENLHHENNLGIVGIARKFDVNESTIRYWFDKLNIERRTKPWKNEDTLRRLYHEKRLYLHEIANKYDITESTLRYWFDKFDIERTSMGPKIKPPKMYHLSQGYEVFDPGEGMVRVHRLTAVAEYGFDVVAGNDVHHKNNIPWDNRPSNLVVIGHERHARMHITETKPWEEK